MDTTIIFSVVIIVLAIVVNYIIARKFEAVAEMKGYRDIHAFALCFWLGMIGYVYVAALPTKASHAGTPVAPPSVSNVPRTSGDRNNSVSNVSKAPAGQYNKYECKSVMPSDKTMEGRCLTCGEHGTLTYCKVEKVSGTREIPLCDACIEKYKENAER